MKKIFAILIMSIFSLACVAESYKFGRISIQNNAPKPVNVSDSYGHIVSVSPERSGTLDISVPILTGQTYIRVPTSSSLVTAIIVTDNENWIKTVYIVPKPDRATRITITKDYRVLTE